MECSYSSDFTVLRKLKKIHIYIGDVAYKNVCTVEKHMQNVITIISYQKNNNSFFSCIASNAQIYMWIEYAGFVTECMWNRQKPWLVIPCLNMQWKGYHVRVPTPTHAGTPLYVHTYVHPCNVWEQAYNEGPGREKWKLVWFAFHSAFRQQGKSPTVVMSSLSRHNRDVLWTHQHC